jgi:hypothetical protein
MKHRALLGWRDAFRDALASHPAQIVVLRKGCPHIVEP